MNERVIRRSTPEESGTVPSNIKVDARLPDFYVDDSASRTPLKWAILGTAVVHIILFAVNLPALRADMPAPVLDPRRPRCHPGPRASPAQDETCQRDQQQNIGRRLPDPLQTFHHQIGGEDPGHHPDQHRHPAFRRTDTVLAEQHLPFDEAEEECCNHAAQHRRKQPGKSTYLPPDS